MSAVNDMRQAISLLTKAVSSMAVAPAPSRRRRRRRARAQVQPAQATSPVANGGRKRRRRRNRAAVAPMQADLSAGVIRLQRRERVKVVKATDKAEISDSFDVVPSSFAFLSTLSKSFERSVWHRVSFCWKPLVGGLVGGLVTFGVDWDFAGSVPDRTKVSSYTPNSTWAVREDCENNPLILPASRLMSRQYYMHNSAGDAIDKGPCKIWVVGGVQNDQAKLEIGEIWVSYDITMSGTMPA